MTLSLLALSPDLLRSLEKVTDHLASVLTQFDEGWASLEDWNLIWDTREAIALVKKGN